MSEIKTITQEQHVGKHPFEWVNATCQRAKECNHKFWINGVPVSEKFYQYVTEFKAKWFDVVLCVDDRTTGERLVDGNGYESYGVYNNFGISSADAPNKRIGKLFIEGEHYCVQSPRIKNDKFNVRNDGYHIRKSKDMKKMIKVARQFIKPLSLSALYDEYEYNAQAALRDLRNPARDKLRDVLVMESEYVADEVANMLRMGYVPATKSFREALDLMRGEGAELKRLKDYRPRMCFVWAKQKSVAYRYSDSTEEIEIVDLNDLPPDLHHKLGVLNIAAKGSPIADVGVRVTDEFFWVFV